jgi:hypothetical protein
MIDDHALKVLATALGRVEGILERDDLTDQAKLDRIHDVVTSLHETVAVPPGQ